MVGERFKGWSSSCEVQKSECSGQLSHSRKIHFQDSYTLHTQVNTTK